MPRRTGLAVADVHDRGVDAAHDRLNAAEAGDLFLLLDMLERKRNIAGHIRQQREFFLVEKFRSLRKEQ